ncbi:MAG: S-layer homology domain-containing protein [Candidatus Gracilibacteria bacterium]|jgi:hypothetical protein
MSKKLGVSIVFVLAIAAITVFTTGLGPLFKSDITSAFSDVSKDSDKFDAIDYLNKQEILLGNSDGTFKPNSTLNRAEWATILARISGANPTLEKYNNCFPDVKDEWYAPAVCLAKEQGWVKGYMSGELKGLYGPGREVQDIEVLVTLARLTKWQTEDDDLWYAPALSFAKAHNIYDENKPIKNISRDKTADVIFRTVDVLGSNKDQYSQEDNDEISTKPIYDALNVDLPNYNDPYKPKALKSLYKKEFKDELSSEANQCKNRDINIAEQLRNAFDSFGLDVPPEKNMQIRILTPPDFVESEPVKKQTLKCGEEMNIVVRLGENFEVLPNYDEVERRNNELGKQQQGANYLMTFSVFSFCSTDGKCKCFVSTEVINVGTRVIEAQSVSDRGDCGELSDKFVDTIRGIEDSMNVKLVKEDPKWYTDNTPDTTVEDEDDDNDDDDDDTTPTDTTTGDDDASETENEVSYKFTCTHSSTYDAELGAYEYSLAGNTDPVDSDGNKTYAPANTELPGGGVASIGGKFCDNPEDLIPRCKNPKTGEVENNINFTKTYPFSEYTNAQIKTEVDEWFFEMTGNTVTCSSVN